MGQTEREEFVSLCVHVRLCICAHMAGDEASKDTGIARVIV